MLQRNNRLCIQRSVAKHSAQRRSSRPFFDISAVARGLYLFGLGTAEVRKVASLNGNSCCCAKAGAPARFYFNLTV